MDDLEELLERLDNIQTCIDGYYWSNKEEEGTLEYDFLKIKEALEAGAECFNQHYC